MLFILSSAHSRDYEGAVGNGGAGLEHLKQKVKFPCPDLFLILAFSKSYLPWGCLQLLEWVQGWNRKKYLMKQGFVVHHEELSLSH